MPDFYNPEKELVETLRLVCNSADQGQVTEVAKKVRGGMNRDQFKGQEKGKNANADDGDKEYYFDCTILDKLDNKGQPVEEIKADTDIDLMDFISKSDFSTVNNGAGAKPSQANTFDFDNFGSGQPEQKPAD